MQDLCKLIELAQNNDEEAMIKLIDQFMPLINKYTRIMNYDEDFKSEMILKFINIIMCDINFDKFKVINNYIIIKYIESSIYHHYILLSKNHNNIKVTEINYENETLINILNLNTQYFDNNEEKILLNSIKLILTEREFYCFELTILQGYTSIEVAKLLGITKQGVNQCKKRALEKIRKEFYNI